LPLRNVIAGDVFDIVLCRRSKCLRRRGQPELSDCCTQTIPVLF
jgi:hypothetical protein